VPVEPFSAPSPAAPALDFTRPPRSWTRRQRAQLAAQLHRAMPTAEVARRLGVSPSTVRAYLNDPDGTRARARRRVAPHGQCGQCGSPTGPARGERRFALCPTCAAASRATWTPASALAAYLDWWARFGRQPTSTDWNHTHALRLGDQALARFRARPWPTTTVICRLFGGWRALAEAARAQHDRTR